MRIQIGYPSFDPPMGGVENYILSVAEFFSDRAASVEVVTGPSRSSSDKSRSDAAGLKILRHPDPRPARLWNLVRPLKETFAYETWMKTLDPPDLFLGRHPTSLVAARRAYGPGVPMLYLPADRLDRRNQFEAQKFRGRRRFFAQLFTPQWRYLERLAARMAQRTVVFSENMRELFLELDVPRPILNPAGVDLGRFEGPSDSETIRSQLGIPPEAKLVLMVSRLAPSKNVGYALRALAPVSQAHLVVLGEGDLRPELEDEAKSLGISDRVHLVGRIPDPERYYRAADLFFHSAWDEPFGQVFLEAMASGLAMAIPGNSGPGPETQKQGSFHGRVGAAQFLPPSCFRGLDLEDPSQGAEVLRELLGDADLREEMGRAGVETVREEYSWEKHLRGLFELVALPFPEPRAKRP